MEPAHGEKREENLRIAGIKTYFIVRPLVPVRFKAKINWSGYFYIKNKSEIF